LKSCLQPDANLSQVFLLDRQLNAHVVHLALHFSPLLQETFTLRLLLLLGVLLVIHDTLFFFFQLHIKAINLLHQSLHLILHVVLLGQNSLLAFSQLVLQDLDVVLMLDCLISNPILELFSSLLHLFQMTVFLFVGSLFKTFFFAFVEVLELGKFFLSFILQTNEFLF